MTLFNSAATPLLQPQSAEALPLSAPGRSMSPDRPGIWRRMWDSVAATLRSPFGEEAEFVEAGYFCGICPTGHPDDENCLRAMVSLCFDCGTVVDLDGYGNCPADRFHALEARRPKYARLKREAA